MKIEEAKDWLFFFKDNRNLMGLELEKGNSDSMEKKECHDTLRSITNHEHFDKNKFGMVVFNIKKLEAENDSR